MASSQMNRGRGRSISQLSTPNEDELASIGRHFEFVNTTFKNSISDLDSIIAMLRGRLAAEESYVNGLYKVKRSASYNDGERLSSHHESQLTFQNAVKLYEGTIDDIIESRQRLKDTIRLEIDVLVKQKEIEEHNRKTHKTRLADTNNNYNMYRNRDISKLHKAYLHKCEELTTAQSNYQAQQQQQQQQQAQQQQIDGGDSYKSNRNSTEISNSTRLSGEYGSRDIDNASILSHGNNADQHNKKGMAGLISQMRTRAAANAYLAPLDQNKQIAKFAKMKKDITDADTEYRKGILNLELLRKKQTKASEEVNRQLKNTIKRKTDTIKTSLSNILHSELESLQTEMNIARASYDVSACIDSHKDIQLFNIYYQNQGFLHPTPVRYRNYYLEGDCKEVLFGGSLETYAIEHNKTVPTIVTRCIEAIEKMGGLQKEGIYRVSGRQSNIEQLKHQFELDEEKVSLEAYEVFTIATILKMYIRELERPLFDFNVKTRSAYSKNMLQAQRFQLLETKLSNLSLAHRSTLLYIVRHLARVNSNSQLNKMNIPNLALIFTPVIFHDFNQAEEGISDWSPDDLFEDLILHHELLFPRAEEVARRNNEPKLQQALNGKSPYSQFSQSNLLYLSSNVAPLSTNNAMLLTQPMNPPVISQSGPNSPGGTLDQHNNPYPPKLTTIIGNAPPGNHQRISSLSQPPTQQQYSVRPNMTPDQGRIIPPRYQSDITSYEKTSNSYQQSYQNGGLMRPQDSSMNRSLSDNTVMQRGSSMPVNTDVSNTPLPDLKRGSHQFNKSVGTVTTAPPRHDSLRKANPRFHGNSEKVLEEQESHGQPQRPSIVEQYQANLSQEYMINTTAHDSHNLDSFVEFYVPDSNEQNK